MIKRYLIACINITFSIIGALVQLIMLYIVNGYHAFQNHLHKSTQIQLTACSFGVCPCFYFLIKQVKESIGYIIYNIAGKSACPNIDNFENFGRLRLGPNELLNCIGKQSQQKLDETIDLVLGNICIYRILWKILINLVILYFAISVMCYENDHQRYLDYYFFFWVVTICGYFYMFIQDLTIYFYLKFFNQIYEAYKSNIRFELLSHCIIFCHPFVIIFSHCWLKEDSINSRNNTSQTSLRDQETTVWYAYKNFHHLYFSILLKNEFLRN